MNNVFNQPRLQAQIDRIDALSSKVDNFIRECGYIDCNVDAVIRAEKSCLIDDIFRVTKASCCLDAVHQRNLASPVDYFDRLYELSIVELELVLAQMCAILSRYMRDSLSAAMQNCVIGFRKSADDCDSTPYRGCDSE